MSVGSVWRVDIVWDFSGVARPIENVVHYRQLTTEVAATVPEDLAQAVIDEALPSMADCITDSITCNLLRVRGISDPTEGGDFSVPGGVTGTLTGQTYAPQCAPLISWKTGLIGRHYAGRTYMPPPTEGTVDGAGQIGTTLLGNLLTAASAMKTLNASGAHAGYDLVIYSKPGPGGSGWMGAITAVQSFSVRAHVKTQRRRSL